MHSSTSSPSPPNSNNNVDVPVPRVPTSASLVSEASTLPVSRPTSIHPPPNNPSNGEEANSLPRVVEEGGPSPLAEKGKERLELRNKSSLKMDDSDDSKEKRESNYDEKGEVDDDDDDDAKDVFHEKGNFKEDCDSEHSEEVISSAAISLTSVPESLARRPSQQAQKVNRQTSELKNPELEHPDLDDQQSLDKQRTVQEADPYFVQWDDPDGSGFDDDVGGDMEKGRGRKPKEMENPRNWSRGKKWYLASVSCALLFNATFASAAPSGATSTMLEYFHSSEEIVTCVTALFVAGYIFGPILWAPLSEIYGRRLIFIITMVSYTITNIICAVTPNITVLIIFRFIGGFFASCPNTNSGGVIKDLFSPSEVGAPMTMFGAAPFIGPMGGPIITSFMTLHGPSTSWRNVFWLQFGLSFVLVLLLIFTLPETYGPYLLVKKAQRLRSETGNPKYYAKEETRQENPFKIALTRPVQMFFKEPILALICGYIALCYGLIYFLFEAFPVVFQGHWGWNNGVATLPFLAVYAGTCSGLLSGLFYYNPQYSKAYIANNYEPVPEARLPGTYISSACLVFSLFFFGWTAHVHPALPTLAGFFLGYAVFWAFFGFQNYLSDVYRHLTASAFAASAVTRSVFGAAFPLFTRQMMEGMGTNWACTLIGCIALAMFPMPFLFYRYGPQIRKKSRYAVE